MGVVIHVRDYPLDVRRLANTIDGVFTGIGTDTGVMSFGLTSALTAADQARLVLHVDGSSTPFAFSAVTPNSAHTYQWRDTGLDWSLEDYVTLRLRQVLEAPAAPTDFTAAAGDTVATLSWSAPASGSGITRHDYRQKTDGDYPAN